MRESRAHALFAHVQLALRHTGRTEAEFADAVVALYHARTPLHARAIEFHGHVAGSDPYDVMRANAQLLMRALKPGGPVRLPVDLEEALVLALPQPYQDECQRELAARLGLLSAPLPVAPDAAMAQQIKSPCELLRRAAAAVERIAPMLEDNKGIGPEDAAHFADVLKALNDVAGVCVTINAQVVQAMRQAQDSTVTPLRARAAR